MTDPVHQPTTGIPRWVKVSGLVVAIVIIAFVVFMMVGGGFAGMHNGGRGMHGG